MYLPIMYTMGENMFFGKLLLEISYYLYYEYLDYSKLIAL